MFLLLGNLSLSMAGRSTPMNERIKGALSLLRFSQLSELCFSNCELFVFFFSFSSKTHPHLFFFFSLLCFLTSPILFFFVSTTIEPLEKRSLPKHITQHSHFFEDGACCGIHGSKTKKNNCSNRAKQPIDKESIRARRWQQQNPKCMTRSKSLALPKLRSSTRHEPQIQARQTGLSRCSEVCSSRSYQAAGEHANALETSSPRENAVPHHWNHYFYQRNPPRQLIAQWGTMWIRM
jgi:hypothetical protein